MVADIWKEEARFKLYMDCVLPNSFVSSASPFAGVIVCLRLLLARPCMLQEYCVRFRPSYPLAKYRLSRFLAKHGD